MPSPEITIEHVLPENPSDNWPEFNDVAAAAEVYRIGNITLLEEGLNCEAGNHTYEVKAPSYRAAP
ncbi:HNH endonuclease [Pistricoccus aurantiacus]|uniref:HNH endonuclease n=1 Tax=Pistricoccus aurantiacus TaxID=1883414 RepID=A0A5B8SQL7_9GAMM|nr:HNH endonuclease family protein [Pistricoccus aurantiacus]QEA37685.1 HNH endonuclease [Pistricoccus aurantiacus]